MRLVLGVFRHYLHKGVSHGTTKELSDRFPKDPLRVLTLHSSTSILFHLTEISRVFT